MIVNSFETMAVRDTTPVKVILDTSGILAPFQNKFNLEEAVIAVLGIKPIFLIPRKVILELQALQEKKGAVARAARAGLQLLKVLGKEIDSPVKGFTDKILIDLARKEQAILLTMDRKLRDAALKKGVSVISGRSGHWLILEEASLV